MAIAKDAPLDVHNLNRLAAWIGMGIPFLFQV